MYVHLSHMAHVLLSQGTLSHATLIGSVDHYIFLEGTLLKKTLFTDPSPLTGRENPQFGSYHLAGSMPLLMGVGVGVLSCAFGRTVFFWRMPETSLSMSTPSKGFSRRSPGRGSCWLVIVGSRMPWSQPMKMRSSLSHFRRRRWVGILWG